MKCPPPRCISRRREVEEPGRPGFGLRFRPTRACGADYKANRQKSADRLEFSLAHLLPALGPCKAIAVSAKDVTAYRVQRQDAGAAPATANRELAALKRMFSLAIERERLQRMPHIAMLTENN